jgi:muconate cycloisomerase
MASNDQRRLCEFRSIEIKGEFRRFFHIPRTPRMWDERQNGAQMTRIVSIETIPCRLPPRRELITGGRGTTNEERLLLRIVTNDGIEGWGEATALPLWGGINGQYYGETVATVSHAIHDLFATVLLGADPMAPALVLDALDNTLRGHFYAKSTVEMALQDIRGKKLGEPLYRLLGGPFRDRVRIAHMIAIMSDEDAVEEATRSVQNDAITAFQVKGGRDPDRDVRLVRKLRRTLPPDIFLRLDANRGYGAHAKTVADIARKLEDAGLDALEQPANSTPALAACKRAVSIPIIADESCWQGSDVVALANADAVDAISLYVAKAGGMARAVEVGAVANLLGFPCDVNGSLESGIGTAASIQTAMAVRAATLPSVVSIPSLRDRPLTQVAGRYWTDDVVVEGFSYEKGFLVLGDRPGLGIVVDGALVDKMAAPGRRLSQTERPVKLKGQRSPKAGKM